MVQLHQDMHDIGVWMKELWSVRDIDDLEFTSSTVDAKETILQQEYSFLIYDYIKNQIV
jgi:hypothetical protein